MKREKVELELIKRCKEYYQDYIFYTKNNNGSECDQNMRNRCMKQYLQISSFLEEIGRPIADSTFTRWYNEEVEREG